jgi:hypothetical protein
LCELTEENTIGIAYKNKNAQNRKTITPWFFDPQWFTAGG